MQAKETNLFQFLEGNKQFIIPIYQRTYSWTQEQCLQLWQDIARAATTSTIQSHFIGSIVYIQEGLYQIAGTQQFLVIDGQQRLTTLTLLLVAVAQASRAGKPHTDFSSELIYDYFLMNRHGKNMDRYKLLLTQSDRDTLIALTEERDLPKETSPRLVANYRFFQDRIRDTKMDLDTLYKGIGKLIVVSITLDREHDNPQLIFESLNSTGLELSQADLIRNYILMRLPPDHQQRLYEQHWYPIETLFGQARYATHSDRFLRDYLTMKSRSIPRADKTYSTFKTYQAESEHIAIDDVLADIHRFAKLYVHLAFTDGEQDSDIQAALYDINDIEVSVAYPFLLEVYADFKEGAIAKEDFLIIIRLVESYVFRRAICDIPTNSMNKTFATFMKTVNKADYRRNIEVAFMELDSYKHFPRDDEFQRAFIVKDIYHFQRRNYLLRKLENYGRKERVNVEGFTIEHIMPQNPQLSVAWQQELGEHWKDSQNRYLHTIGNVTLTGYNSEMSDHSFAEKRDLPKGFGQSSLYLNESIRTSSQWDEAAITKRAKTLAQRAISIWPIPHIDDAKGAKKPANGRGAIYSLEHYTAQATDTTFELLLALRQRILNLDGNVRELFYKNGIVYRIPDQFAWVHPNQVSIKVAFSSFPGEIKDPRHALDVGNLDSKTGRLWSEYSIRSAADLDYATYLINQSLQLHRRNDEDKQGQIASDFDEEDLLANEEI
jgi:uncharacterized protein with ParB-like and HNH nuclease domain/predicted transport protein